MVIFFTIVWKIFCATRPRYTIRRRACARRWFRGGRPRVLPEKRRRRATRLRSSICCNRRRRNASTGAAAVVVVVVVSAVRSSGWRRVRARRPRPPTVPWLRGTAGPTAAPVRSRPPGRRPALLAGRLSCSLPRGGAPSEPPRARRPESAADARTYTSRSPSRCLTGSLSRSHSLTLCPSRSTDTHARCIHYYALRCTSSPSPQHLLFAAAAAAVFISHTYVCMYKGSSRIRNNIIYYIVILVQRMVDKTRNVN